MEDIVEALIEGVGDMLIWMSLPGTGKNSSWGCVWAILLLIAVVAIGVFFYT